jgi:tRNA threonylcarbamoyladenosine biosynthesis protein TsaB
MSGLRLLAIDTSTEACSAALLWSDGELKLRFTLTERGHAELILPMVDQLLVEAGCRLGDLDGLAFGRGPGGFTGLRIAAGVVQGLAFGAGLRVAPVSSLAAVAFLVTSPAPAGEVARSAGEGRARSAGEGRARSAGEGMCSAGEGILVINDARMHEYYWACYRFDASAPCAPVLLTPERVGPGTSIASPPSVRHCAGNGLARDPSLQARLAAAGLTEHSGLYPRADAVARLGQAVFLAGLSVAPADAVPEYVRDDVVKATQVAVT